MRTHRAEPSLQGWWMALKGCEVDDDSSSSNAFTLVRNALKKLAIAASNGDQYGRDVDASRDWETSLGQTASTGCSSGKC